MGSWWQVVTGSVTFVTLLARVTCLPHAPQGLELQPTDLHNPNQESSASPLAPDPRPSETLSHIPSVPGTAKQPGTQSAHALESGIHETLDLRPSSLPNTDKPEGTLDAGGVSRTTSATSAAFEPVNRHVLNPVPGPATKTSLHMQNQGPSQPPSNNLHMPKQDSHQPSDAQQMEWLNLGTSGALPLQPSPQNVHTIGQLPEAEGPMPRARGDLTQNEASLLATVASLVPGTVPPDVLNSSDLRYMLPLPRITADHPIPAKICENSTFIAITPAQLASQTPMNSMGRVYITFDGVSFKWCSGMLLSSNLLLTAGHCVYNCSTGRLANSAIFFDRFYKGDFANKSVAVNVSLNTICQNNLPLFDFALLRLATPLAARIFPVTVESTLRALGVASLGILYSYPAVSFSGEIPFTSNASLANYGYFGNGKSRLEVFVSSEPGSSGGPLFIEGLPSNQYLQSTAIIGVISYEYTDVSRGCPNGFAAFQPGWSPRLMAAVSGI
eukprot:jgi/Botrbrau1/11209/Bobra.0075s0005.1